MQPLVKCKEHVQKFLLAVTITCLSEQHQATTETLNL